MEFKAFKMDGLGNDFVIIDERFDKINLRNKDIIKICNRKFIGCDQLIIIREADQNDAELIFYNSDGSLAGACGNGTRCVAYLLSKENNKNLITLKTLGGILESKIYENQIVETKIGPGKLSWADIPLKEKMDTRNLNFNFEDIQIEMKNGTALNVGNPHVVFFVDELEKFNIEKIGPKIENHNFFPEKCNVTIAKKVNENHIKLKVWERGAGLTKACGTAACATALAGKINNLIKSPVNLVFELGKLEINIDDNDFISMKGPVSKIQEIKINF